MSLGGNVIRTGVAAASALALAGGPEASAEMPQALFGENIPGAIDASTANAATFDSCARLAFRSAHVDVDFSRPVYTKPNKAGRSTLRSLGVEIHTELDSMAKPGSAPDVAHCEGVRTTETTVTLGKRRDSANKIFELSTSGNGSSITHSGGIRGVVPKICKDETVEGLFTRTIVSYEENGVVKRRSVSADRDIESCKMLIVQPHKHSTYTGPGINAGNQS